MVFAHHSNVLDGLEEAVQGMKYTNEKEQVLRAGHMRIDGRTSSKLRSDRVKTFQGDEHCRVALLSIKAAGVRIWFSTEEVTRIDCKQTGLCLVAMRALGMPKRFFSAVHDVWTGHGSPWLACPCILRPS